MRVKILKLGLALFAWVDGGYAETPASRCESLTSYRDVLQCAVENSPQALQAKLLIEQNKNLIGLAGQRPNPEVSSQFLGGKAGDDKYQYTQVNLAHTFELGGKRSARIKRSEMQVASTEFDLKLAQEQIYLRTYLAMIRLRQISSETEIYDDALATFERIQKQYRSRPRMTPEQRATYTIMDIAANDYKLRRKPLINEARDLERFLEQAIGRKLDVKKDFFPAFRKKWPRISTSNIENSLTLRKSLVDVELAKAELDEAKSDSWPDLKLGPSFETQSQGTQRINSLGLNLSFAIPIFHVNGAGRSFAAAGVSRAEMILASTRTAENQRLQVEIEKYNDAVASLESSISTSDLHKRHREVESAFANGVVPSSLIIEIHRQLADYSKSLSEQENSAIESLAEVYSIQGRLLSEGL